MLPPMSHAEILAEVVERPRRGYVPLPDLEIIERPGWMQLVTPSIRGGGLNEVSLARLADHEADDVIDRTIARYRANGSRFVWRIGPDSRPADLGARLARRGLVHEVGVGMARATELAERSAAGIRVDEIDVATVDLYTRTMAAGWGMDPGPLARVDALAAAAPHHHLFVAHVDGEPAAAAAYVAFPRSAYLMGGVTLAPFRRRGVYRALVAARLAHALARGIPLATSLARATTAAPILASLGFAAIAHYDNYRG